MEKVVFNPDYFLRHDEKRTFIINRYSFNQSTYGWYSIIHPLHAMVFSFFMKNQTLDIVLRQISDFIDLPITEVQDLVNPFISNPEDVFVIHDNIQFNIPSNVLIYSGNDIDYEKIYLPEDFYCREYDFTTKRYLKAPLNVTFMPNNVCVTDCIYCYADKIHKVDHPILFDRIMEIMDEAKTLEVLNFSVVGGEVFTYPHWRELLEKIKKR